MNNPNLMIARRCLHLVASMAMLLATNAVAAPDQVTAENQMGTVYGALPLNFEANRGQTDRAVDFLARAGGYVLFLSPTEAVLALDDPAARAVTTGRRDGLVQTDRATLPSRTVVRMQLAAANRAPARGIDELALRSHYFSGPEPGSWRADIPNYARVRYGQVYPGIDLVYYGNRRQLEYDFVLAPGADPVLVKLVFTGMSKLEISASGDLLLHTARGQLVQRKPSAYQLLANGRRQEIAVTYARLGANSIGFRVGAYDRSRVLTIDPVLAYSTYLGGNGFDQGYAIAVDSFGSAYVTGTTAAVDFPTTSGAYQTTYGGGDAFIAKLNPEGSALVYSTYLSGASGNGIAVDSAGNAYVTGHTLALNFPTTSGAFQTAPYDYDVFITKLNPTGSALVYSSRFGSNFADFGRGIALDVAGNAYVTGWTVCRAPTCNFPTVNAFQPDFGGGYNDAFVSKLNSSGSALVYSTYLGGGAVLNATDDWGEAIAVDSAGSAYVTGYTYAPDFPVTTNAFDTTRGGLDAFISKFSPTGTALMYSTFLGGAGREQGMGIAVDASGNAYITGLTESYDNPFTSATEGFPVTPGAFRTTGSFDAFVTKLNPQGSGLVYSTYLGGSADVDRGWAIAIDGAGSAYVMGDTKSSNFPVASAVQGQYGGGLSDAFVTKLDPSGAALVYSTFLGGSLYDEGRGIALSASGDAFAIGTTSSDNFPTASPLQPSNGGGLNNHDDAFVVKLRNTDPPAPAPALSSLSLNPTSVSGGTASQGTVTLTSVAPAGGLVVALSSSNPSVASVPAAVTVAAGVKSAVFAVATVPVTTSTFLNISALYAGVGESATLMVTAPATSDTVAVTLAQYRTSRKILTLQATSTSASATLKSYVTSTGQLIGTLSNNGGGKYSARLVWPSNPQNVTVRSSLGGSASKLVVTK